jgi:Spy/CpxP family protein refolding chaperone
MKIKLMPMLAGVLVLGAVAAPFAVNAQANPSVKPLMAQAQRQGKEGKWGKINLTDAQKQQMRQIKEETRTQIQQVLTPAQRAQMEAMKQNRQGQNGQRQARQGQGRRGGMMASLNLTAEQEARIKEIMTTQKSRMDQVLTAEQRQQWSKCAHSGSNNGNSVSRVTSNQVLASLESRWCNYG